MRFETKIAVVIRDDLAGWQRLNVCAFLVSGIAAAVPELIGEPYADADGTKYLAMFDRPVLVFEAAAGVLTAAHARALSRGLPMSIFTADLFATGNDEDNRAAVRAVGRDRLDLAGLAVHGPRNAVDKIVKVCACILDDPPRRSWPRRRTWPLPSGGDRADSRTCTCVSSVPATSVARPWRRSSSRRCLRRRDWPTGCA